MPRRSRPRLFAVLRLMALAVLAFGVLVKPVLAMNCELQDVQRALAGVAVDDAATADTGDECCPGQSCGECCTVGTVVPAASAPAIAMIAADEPAFVRIAPFAPADYPVAIRPPIAV